jgi:transglutaminase-like putative cysteine protease
MDIINGTQLIQEVTEITASKQPDSGEPSKDNTDNSMMLWENTINATTETITVDFKVRTETIAWDRDYYKIHSGSVSDIEQKWKDKYNHDEWLIDDNSNGILDPEDDIDSDGEWDYRIEPTDPVIKSLAVELTSNKTTAYDKIFAIYEFLISDDVLDYDTVSKGGLPKGCTETLQDGTGDSDDYSILFVSLCRAADIPARLNFGTKFIPQNDNIFEMAWSEVYIPVKDGSNIWGTVDIVNKRFLIRDPYLITNWIDTGDEVLMNISGELMSNLDYNFYVINYIGSGKLDVYDYEVSIHLPASTLKVEIFEDELRGKTE